MPKTDKTVVKTQDVRRIKKSLKCKFTDAEVLQLGRDLAEKTEQYGQLEADKKQVTKDFDAKLAEVDAQIRSASGKVQCGYEYRSIDCTETFGEPDAAKKTVRRLDSGDIVEVRELTDEEKQRHLNFLQDQPADDAKLAELLPQKENNDVATP